MGGTYSEPLVHHGPFIKPSTTSSFLGMPITNYTMPLVNPEDGSYMPTCAQGPCTQYTYIPYMNSRGRMSTRAQCVQYGPPTRIPQQTNTFSLKPSLARHSCGWANPNNSSQYYVAYSAAQQPIQQPIQQQQVQQPIQQQQVQQPIQQQPIQQQQMEPVPYAEYPVQKFQYGKSIPGGKTNKSKKTGSNKTRTNKARSYKNQSYKNKV